MKKYLLIGLFALLCSDIICCSGFVYKGRNSVFLCSSIDQMALHGYVIVNKRDVEKTNFLATTPRIIKWISKYGSVTFSSIGKEFPQGGMNEKGLTVAIMTTPPMEYPISDNRFELNESQWIQYVLDNFSSVKEIIESDSLIRVNRFFDNWHYMICDKDGNIAIVEFKNGKMKVYSGSDVQIPVLENDMYEKSIEKYKSDKSLYKLSSRFSKLAFLLENFDVSRIDLNEPKVMFPILENVKQPDLTKWQIVYDIKNLKIVYRTNTFKYLTDRRSKNYSRGISEGMLDFKKLDFTGTTIAAKLGIIGVSNNQLLPYNTIFDSEILKFNVEIFKSQGAKSITNTIVEKYIQFSQKD